MKYFLLFVWILISNFSFAHKGNTLAITKVSRTDSKFAFNYTFIIDNIIDKNLYGVRIEFISNGKTIDYIYYDTYPSKPKHKIVEFSISKEKINPDEDLIQIEITQIFNKKRDWGGWDSQNIMKQTNTISSEFYVDAPWRMKKTDITGNINSIPLHFFLHDADEVIGFILSIDYIDIKIKSVSDSIFDSVLTYNNLSINDYQNIFSCISNQDSNLNIQEFNLNSFSPTASHTLDFDIESDFINDYVSVNGKYWFFTFNIPFSDLTGLDNIIDIEATIAYGNSLIPNDDVIRMRVFRSNTDIPLLENYYRGDTHLHSIYTQNSAEIGLPLCATKEAAKLIGLDWITTTDHTSDFDNYGNGNIHTNWSFLQNEVEALNFSDSSLIYIAGQEVAVNNSENKLVHMLAYPDYNNPFNFPFLGDGNGDTSPSNTSINDVIDMLIPVKGFSYNAHPFATNDALPAFPVNGGIWNLGDTGFPINGSIFPKTGGLIACNNLSQESDILDSSSTKLIKDAIKGSQIWNLRPNVEVSGSDGNNLDPWDVLNTGFPMTQKDTSDYNFHFKRLMQGFEIVNYINQLGLNKKNGDANTQNWKLYYSAGADAHGSFNSNNTDNFGGLGVINNNAVGKVNTVTYCPNGLGINGSEILKALYNGSSTMSDGPILTIGISMDGDNQTSEIFMGQDSILDASLQSNIFLNFDFTTTPEFGDFTKLTFIIGTQTGELERNITITSATGTVNESYNLMNLMDSVFSSGNTPLNQFVYLRAEIETFADYSSDNSAFRTDYDIFRSFTNPIWIKWNTILGEDKKHTPIVSISPNPTNKKIKILNKQYADYTGYYLYNNQGILLIKKENVNKLEFIDFDKYSSGFYNLLMQDNSGNIVSRKIIKL